MWKKLILFGLLMSLIACKKDQKEEQNPAAKQQTKEFKDEHNARTALDYIGVYSGELPCADCSSIRYKIELNQDQSFHAKYVYVGKSNDVFDEVGYYKWAEDGNVIHLKTEDGAAEYKFKVGEGWILMLQQNGKEIESAFKEKYYLKKS